MLDVGLPILLLLPRVASAVSLEGKQLTPRVSGGVRSRDLLLGKQAFFR